MDEKKNMPAPSRWENQRLAKQKRQQLVEKLKSSLGKRKSTAAVEPANGQEHQPPLTTEPGAKGAAADQTGTPQRFGQAKVRLRRDIANDDCKPSIELENLVEVVLHAAQTRERTVVLHWPGSLSRLALAHVLATLERWAVGDKLGLRSLIYPAKTNSFDVLNHVTLNRDDVLHWARELLETPGEKNPRVTRGLPDKDAYLFSLAHPKKDLSVDLHPTAGELLPRFSVIGEFKGWASCDTRLLEHSAAKIGRRLRRALRKEQCPVIGSPLSAPDAAFSLHYAMNASDIRRALTALRKAGAPEVVLVDATRTARRSLGPEWAKPIGQFVAMVHEVFKQSRPGIVLVADEPQVAEHLKHACIEACMQLDKDVRQLSKTSFDVQAVACRVSGDGLIDARAEQLKAPTPRNIQVRATDADAAKVVHVLQRYAAQCPGGRPAAQEAVDAANFVHRLSVLPASVRHLMEWIDEVGDPRLRDKFTWVYYRGRLRELIDRVGRGSDPKGLEDALKRADEIWSKYQNATAFALQLANAVGMAANSPKRIAVVFDRPLRRRMAERFLDDYADFPGGKRLIDFKERVRLLLGSDVDACLAEGWASKFVFAGLDETNLRTVIVDERLPQDSVILLAQRSAQYLHGVLRRVLIYPAFACFKARIESMERQLSAFTAMDDKLILRIGDMALPDFEYQSVFDANRSSDGSTNDAYEVVLEGGRHIYRRGGSEVFLYDPASQVASDRGFRRIQLDNLKEGDRLFDMSPDLRERVESALRDAGVPIQRDKRFEASLRKYHEVVTEAVNAEFKGQILSGVARQLSARMKEENPNIKDWPTESAVRHWVNLGRNPDVPFDDLQPQAPMKREHYFALCKALRLNDVMAQYFLYQVILPIRNARRLDGRYVSDTYSHMLLEPESVMVHAGLKRSVIEDLFARAMDNIYVVEAVRPPRNSQ